mmetsp:Transcript_318/g.1488  ORF Transcript_318/g.1488 Transcript_318/m.1488 type:complete len:227 (-) Transcript_318:433-1113(-)
MRDKILGLSVAAAGSERPAPPPGPYKGTTTSHSTSVTSRFTPLATRRLQSRSGRVYPASTTTSVAPADAATMTSPGSPPPSGVYARSWIPRLVSSVSLSSMSPRYMNARCLSLAWGNPAVEPKTATRGRSCSLARCTAYSSASLCIARCADWTHRRTYLPRGSTRSKLSLRSLSGAIWEVTMSSRSGGIWAASAARLAKAAALFASALARCSSVSPAMPPTKPTKR